MSKTMRISFLLAALVALAVPAASLRAAWPSGRSSEWHGYPRRDFVLPGDGARCIVVSPKSPAEGAPWIWRARFWGHQPALDLQLLAKGFHLAYCDVGGLFGAPAAVERWNKFHSLAVKEGLSTRPVLEGMSRGGLIIINWASANPDKVSAIYGDNPVCNFNSWPGGRNGKFSKGDWSRCLKAYGISAEAARAHRQPLSPETLKPLAGGNIPIALVLGAADKVVPPGENGELLARHYQALGGPVKVWRKPGKGHHPHGLDPPDELAAWILQAVRGDF